MRSVHWFHVHWSIPHESSFSLSHNSHETISFHKTQRMITNNLLVNGLFQAKTIYTLTRNPKVAQFGYIFFLLQLFVSAPNNNGCFGAKRRSLLLWTKELYVSFLLADGSCHGVQCHHNATCFKPRPEVPGLCICKDGWFGDGRHCKGRTKRTVSKWRHINVHINAFLTHWTTIRQGKI